MNERLVVVDGLRTPFCKMGTSLASMGADELGRIAVNALLARTGFDPGLVDEVQSRANRDGVASLKTLPSLTELIGDPHQPAKRIPDDRFANAATDLTTVDRDPSLAMCEIRGAPGRIGAGSTIQSRRAARPPWPPPNPRRPALPRPAGRPNS